MPYHRLGEFKDQPGIKWPESHFNDRDCWLDCRGKGMIEIDADANIGWCVTFITVSHDPTPGKFLELTYRPIKIIQKVFVGYGAILYNCIIGEGAQVAAGTVVRSRIVPPWTMVEGNPARICKIYDAILQKWIKPAPGMKLELEEMHK